MKFPRFALLFLLCSLTYSGFSQESSVVLTGADLKGGGLGSNPDAFYYDRMGVNAVYAVETGGRNVMKAVFTVDKLLPGSVLKIEGRHHDGKLPDPEISIILNNTILYSGQSGFGNQKWSEREFVIPQGVLKTGQNELAIHNLTQGGVSGRPPWFMVSLAGIGQQGFALKVPRDIFKHFAVTLPEQKVAMQAPEAGKKGFELRGTKGFAWTPEQTLTEIPYLKQFNMNFFMNCYLSMYDYPNEDNQWWKPLDASFKKKYEEIVRLCRENDIEFCFAMNPNLYSSRHINYKSKKDLEDLWQHYEWMAKFGVNWFSVCLDDITTGLDAEAQAEFVNTLYKRLLKVNPKAKLIFCRTIYTNARKVSGIDDSEAYLNVSSI